ncbi:MAG: DUF389 domain-containing protein [Bacteroidales bacterium]|nr:DUF389 domain-containing protein [Bacteroidales bacterium]
METIENETSSKSPNKYSITHLLQKLWQALKYRTQLQDTDIEATIASIHKSVEFKGFNVWILAFAIIIASVGLNVNSTAVIIGAMLISPLMGPINGIGLALGISDRELLRQSLKNLCIMVAISLAASTTYFILSPLGDARSELMARTTPTIFDVLIAFFGGLAGIVALSRKEQAFTVISGVAIATALMPPLCTAGFGLATLQWNFFFGAFYLFFINSCFIALATFLIVRYPLHFPQKKYLDEHRQIFVRRIILIVTIIVIVPSVITAIAVVREAAFENQTNKFVKELQESELFKDIQIVNTTKQNNRKTPTIQLSIIGKTLTDKDISLIQSTLPAYGLKNTQLTIRQTGIFSNYDTPDMVETLIDKQAYQIAEKDSLINELRSQIEKIAKDEELYAQLCDEINVQYTDIEHFSIANTVYYNPNTNEKQIIPPLFVTWKNSPTQAQVHQLTNWLKIRLQVDQLNYQEE